MEGFAKVAVPLHRLVAMVEVSQNKRTHWTLECQTRSLQTTKLRMMEHRWASGLEIFNFEIRYHPSTANKSVNAHSRLPDLIPITAMAPSLAIPPLPLGSTEPLTEVWCQETSALPLWQNVDL